MKGIIVGGGAGGASDPKGNAALPIYFDSEGEAQEVAKKDSGTALTVDITGNADTVDGHHFHWYGKSGQPAWVWGSNVDNLEDSTNMYVYNPAGFSVSHATSAGTATRTSASCDADSKITLVEGSGQSDIFRINYGCGHSDDGYGEIATGDNGTEPIYCRQYNTSGVASHSITLMDGDGYSRFLRAYNAVWNDYAEFREGTGEAGQCVCENANGVVEPSTKRLQKCPNIISDTYGYSMGKQSDDDVAVAVSGRVLACTDKEKSKFKVGDVICSGKNGTVSKMNRLEIILFPDRILGVVCEMPTYSTWGTGNVKVNNRIWVKVK